MKNKYNRRKMTTIELKTEVDRLYTLMERSANDDDESKQFAEELTRIVFTTMIVDEHTEQ